MNTRHENGVCKVCAAKSEDLARIERQLAALKSDPARIEFLLRELRAQKTLDADGRIRTLSRPAAARGRNAKNIARILREGKRRFAEAKAKGVDLSVLPPESKIRKRVEADWNRRTNPPPPRGSAGRRSSAQKRTSGKDARISKVKKMLSKNPDLKPADVAAKFGCSSKTASRDLQIARK